MTASPARNTDASPAISVVIASWCDATLLLRCLESLDAQRDVVEIIVATSMPAEAWQRVQSRFPRVRGGRFAGASVFRLRAIGAAMARGDLVAIIEDHVTVDPQWARALVSAHRAGHWVLGGPVDNGLVHRAFDWALYFVEYGVHMPPVAGGPVPAVSGANVAYDRALLSTCTEVWRDTLQENEVNDTLRARGHVPYMAPAARVATHLPMTLTQAMAHLYSGGRHFGRYRASTSSRGKRLLWIMAWPAVPCVLFARIARRVAVRAPARLWHLARGLVYFVLILGAWSVGELAGYTSGSRGQQA